MAVQSPENRVARDRAKALYMMGLPPSEIGQRLGIKQNTLRIWSQRGSWPAERKAMRVSTANVLDKVAAETMADSVLKHQKQVQEVCERHIGSLKEFQPVASKEFVDVGQALKHFDDVGRRNLGLNDSSSDNKPTTFNFNLANMEITSEKEAKAIDITPPPLPPETHDTSGENEGK